MTVTDQPITDVRCVCGDPKWDHKQGRAACKHCACDTYDPATDPEVAQLRAEVEQLRGVNVELGRARGEIQRLERDNAALVAERDTARGSQLQAARDLSQRLSRAAAENKRLHASLTVLASARDEAQRQAKDAQNATAEMRVQRDAANADRDEARRQAKDAASAAERAGKQVADLEDALVEANKGRRLVDEAHLHERIARAALVIGRFRDWRFCPQCWHLHHFGATEHRCGPLASVDVIVVRRPNPPTTEEQP